MSHGLIKPDPDKIKAIKDFKLPKTIKELRSFLGLVNYCREYIQNYSQIAKPLFEILKGQTKNSNKSIDHDQVTITTFKHLKESIHTGMSRAQPDFSQEFILTTDASEIGIGAILSQIDSNLKENVISTFSKNFDKHQLNYSVTDKELLAVVKGIENYRHYLLGKEFLLRTDHKALTFLKTCKSPTTRLLRWAMKLQEFDYRIEYIKGEENAADGLSRSSFTFKRIGRTELQPEQIKKILIEYHEYLGHGSRNEMKFAISKRYKWNQMYKDIDAYYDKCEICQKAGFERQKAKFKVIETNNINEI